MLGVFISGCGFEPLYVEKKSSSEWYYDSEFDTGIKEEIIERHLKSIDDEDEREKCVKFALKYMKNREFDLKTKQKLFNHLAGKGFDYDDISHSWEAVKNGRD